jgi:PAS domain-containing protein
MRRPRLGAIMDGVLPIGGRGENVGAEAPKRDAAAAAIDAAAVAMTGAQDSSAAGTAGLGETLPSRVLAALPVGVALLDAELHWRYANDAFLRLTGLPAEAASGWPLSATALSRADATATDTGTGTGAAASGTAAAAQAAALVLADGETRELVTGPAEEPIRMRLQRVDPDAGTAMIAEAEAASGETPVQEAAAAEEAEGAAASGVTRETGHPTRRDRPSEVAPRAEPGRASEPAPANLTEARQAPDADSGATAGSLTETPPGGKARPGQGPEAGPGQGPEAESGPGREAGPGAAAGQGGPMVLVVALLDAVPPSRPDAAAAPSPSTTTEAATPDATPAEVPFATPSGAPAGPSDGELRAQRRLATLTAAGERIGTTLDTDTTCAELARFTVPGLADLATVDVLPPGVPEHRLGMPLGTLRLLRAAVAGRPELHHQLATLAHPGESVRHREGSLVARSLVAGKPLLLDLAAIEEGAEGAAAISDPATLEVYRATGITSVLSVPLAARGHLVGALTLARAARSSREDGRGGEGAADWVDEGYSDEDIALIEDLAGRAALSIDNARRYMRSQGIALELQRALLAEPANPHPNMEIACRYLPSGSSSVVGGDWYESVRLPFGRTLLVIGDVMGHGVEAAVDMSTYRSMLRYVAVMDLPPHRILRQLDAMISENDAARPATCLLALVDPPRNRVTFASAGHLPPALVDPSGVTELVPVPSGPPLGTGVGGYQQLVRELVPGAVLLLYTDGLVERRHEDIDASLERLAALPLPAAGDLDDLLDAALHSSPPSEAEDDIAVLAARVRPRPS